MPRQLRQYGNGRVDVFPFEYKHYQEMIRLCLVFRDSADPDSHDYFRWYRNYVLFVLGTNIGARIETLLQLTPKHMNGGKIRITEFKTGKTQRFDMNPDIYLIVEKYINDMKISENEYIFHTFRNTFKPLTRQQAYNIIQELKNKIGIKYEVGCHSLRKSFGRFIYDETKDIYLVQRLLQHSSPRITEQYICLNPETIDKIRKTKCFL